MKQKNTFLLKICSKIIYIYVLKIYVCKNNINIKYILKLCKFPKITFLFSTKLNSKMFCGIYIEKLT